MPPPRGAPGSAPGGPRVAAMTPIVASTMPIPDVPLILFPPAMPARTGMTTPVAASGATMIMLPRAIAR